jgi:hypothetical protein
MDDKLGRPRSSESVEPQKGLRDLRAKHLRNQRSISHDEIE